MSAMSERETIYRMRLCLMQSLNLLSQCLDELKADGLDDDRISSHTQEVASLIQSSNHIAPTLAELKEWETEERARRWASEDSPNPSATR